MAKGLAGVSMEAVYVEAWRVDARCVDARLKFALCAVFCPLWALGVLLAGCTPWHSFPTKLDVPGENAAASTAAASTAEVQSDQVSDVNQSMHLAQDPDPRKRSALLTAAARQGHPRAIALARAALNDTQLSVRLTAIEALGGVGGAAAMSELSRLARPPQPELIRAAAVIALDGAGAADEVWIAADDPSWRVRRAVAASLAKRPSAGARSLACRLVEDKSAAVSEQVIQAVADWPAVEAGPVLIWALSQPSYKTRLAARDQLMTLLPGAKEFPPDGSAEARAEAIRHMQQAWNERYAGLGASRVSVHPWRKTEKGANAAAIHSAEHHRLEQLHRLVQALGKTPLDKGERSQLLDELNSWGANLADDLEQLVLDQQVVIPADIYTVVLPGQRPEFMALAEMDSSDVIQRRRAANRLADGADTAPLCELGLRRLVELGAQEGDPIVCGSLMRALKKDPRQQSLRLAQSWINHPSPEVRRLACEHLGFFPASEHAEFLLAALGDEHDPVVLAAAHALGRLESVPESAPLEDLLASRDKRLRLASATSLARLGYRSGQDALVRLALDEDPDTRRQTVQLMGDLRDSRYLPSLIGRLDDVLGVRLAALAALPKAAGPDWTTPADWSHLSAIDQASRWQQWWRRQEPPAVP